MRIELPHEVEFTNKNTVTVADVAASLLANEQILISAARVLERTMPGLHIERIDVRFISATTNSPLKEAFAAGILVAYQNSLTQTVPQIIEDWTGVHVSDRYKTIITIIVLATVLYGIEQAWTLLRKKLTKDRQAASLPTIQGNFNNVVQVGGNLIGVEPEVIASAISSSFDRKQSLSLARRSLAFIKPAQQEKGAAIVGGGAIIEAAAIEAAPSDLDVEMEEDRAPPLMLQKQAVVIHATDKDHARSGWAGHIPGVWEKRIPMKLFPGISTASLFGKDEAEADIMVVYKKDDEGDDVPEVMHVLRIY